MKKERGCARNHLMRGGSTVTFTSPAGIVQPGFYPEVKVIDTCSVARPGMVQVEAKGLMSGGKRRGRMSRKRMSSKRMSSKRTLRGGMYQINVGGQGMQPNQFAEVTRVPGEGCAMKGGAPFIEVPSVGYANKPELVTSEGGNVVPVMQQVAYNTTNTLSSACKQTGGRSKRGRSKRGRSKSGRSKRVHKSRKNMRRKNKKVSSKRH